VKTLGYSVASSPQINSEAFLFCMEVPNVGGLAVFPKMKGERRGKAHENLGASAPLGEGHGVPGRACGRWEHPSSLVPPLTGLS
jgi:hypothetical protein